MNVLVNYFIYMWFDRLIRKILSLGLTLWKIFLDVQKKKPGIHVCVVYSFFEETCCTTTVDACTINRFRYTGGVSFFIIYCCSLMSMLGFVLCICLLDCSLAESYYTDSFL